MECLQLILHIRNYESAGSGWYWVGLAINSVDAHLALVVDGSLWKMDKHCVRGSREQLKDPIVC